MFLWQEENVFLLVMSRYIVHTCRAVFIIIIVTLPFSVLVDRYLYKSSYIEHFTSFFKKPATDIFHIPQTPDEACSDTLYYFGQPSKNETATIFKDTDLWNRCGIGTSGDDTETLKHLDSPQVRTKCGVVNGTLLSRTTANRTAKSGFLVPNNVHYIIFGRSFTFLNYISFKSVDKFITPKYIFVHGDGLTGGPWWEMTIREVPNIYYIHWPRISIQGHAGVLLPHMSDVVRLYVLQANGGIYLDCDVIVVKSFDPLRKEYPLTMGRASSLSVSNGIIISAPQQPFLCVWYHGYRDYDPTRRGYWGYYSVVTAGKLAELFPTHVHIEERSLLHPSWAEGELPLMFDKLYDWSDNYAIHVWRRLRPKQVPKTLHDIIGLNTTLGQIMRHVLSK